MAILLTTGLSTAQMNHMTPPLPPGEHPRLIFTAQELPALRERAAEERYRPLLANLRGGAEALRKQLDQVAQDQVARDKLAKDSLGQWGYHATNTRAAALYYQLSGEPAAGRTAVDAFIIWLDANPPDDQLQPKESWGVQEYALAYDWIHELLTEPQRNSARRIFASMLQQPTRDLMDREWFGLGQSVTGRRISGANWMALFGSNLAITALAVEGEIDVDESLLPDAIGLVRAFLMECIDADGALYEGMEYASGFGTHHLPPLLMALRRRGVDIYSDSHLSQVGNWQTYETLPWGFESFDHNKSIGRFGAGPLLTFNAREYGGLFLWCYQNGAIEEHGILPNEMIGLLNGLPEGAAGSPDDLPPDRWFAARGLVFARDGWGERDAMAMFGVNPVGAGHTHADQGNFLLAANGAYFIADSSAGNYESRDHNVVHIDDIGQGQREAGLDGFIRHVDRNEYALLADADLSLSYGRLLQGGLNGPWWWKEYNPVQRADRRFLFVRGIAGPLLIVVDEIRKDDQPHRYSWLAHTPQRHVVSVSENGFTIAERFGGSYLETLAKGCNATLVARDVPEGIYRGWLLVRSVPSPAGWASNNLSVNGRKIPYNEAYFGRGFHREGWDWLPLKPDRVAEIVHPGGNLRVGLESHSGGRIALAVFTRDPEWEPADLIPEHGGDFVVIGVESLEQGALPWQIGHAPKGILDAHFLGAPLNLSIDRTRTPKTARVELRAERHDIDGRFVCVMAPHDDGDGRTLTRAEGGLVRKSLLGVDTIVSGWDAVPAGTATTDAQVAVISRHADGHLVSYAMAAGSRLADASGELITAQAGTHLLHDGTTLVIRAPAGSRITCRRLQATTLQLNGLTASLPAGDPVVIDVPTPESGWRVAVENEGTIVQLTGGNAPLPRIEAPAAIELRVNGIKRYFTRDGEGLIHPVLQDGVTTIHFRNRITAADLRQYESQRRDGAIHYTLPAVPGRYRVTVGDKVQELVTATDTLPVVVQAETHPATMEIIPMTRPIPAANWLAIGPFAIPGTDGQDMGGDTVRASLTHPLPPEIAIDPSAIIESGGRSLRWVPGDSEEGWRVDGKIVPVAQWSFADRAREAGVNFLPACGVRRGELCYAATIVTSPGEREALLQIGCDFWATAFVNGEEVTSERAKQLSHLDGARFHGDSPMTARIRLKAGANLLLVKCRGGGGSNSFVAYISDPGDLHISPPTPH